MQNPIDSIHNDFKDDVVRVENLLKLMKAFRDFGASTPPLIASTEKDKDIGGQESEVWVEAVSLHTESKQRRTDLPIFSGSLLLYLVGRFEYCIRQIIQGVADDIAGKSSKYDHIPTNMKKIIKQRTLEIAQNPKKYGYDEISSEVLLQSLVENIRGNQASVNIKSEVISITESNMRPNVLQDILKGVGIKDFWQELGKQANVKIILGESVDNEACKKAQAKLNDIMEERNQIAHPTASTQFPDADGVLERAEFLKTLASNATDFAKVHLASYTPPAS